MEKETTNFGQISDYVFKKLFGTEENKNILLSFLNTFIENKSGTITDVKHLDIKRYEYGPFDNDIVISLLCTNEKNEQFYISLNRQMISELFGLEIKRIRNLRTGEEIRFD